MRPTSEKIWRVTRGNGASRPVGRLSPPTTKRRSAPAGIGARPAPTGEIGRSVTASARADARNAARRPGKVLFISAADLFTSGAAGSRPAP
jgi:hypothetical protein